MVKQSVKAFVFISGSQSSGSRRFLSSISMSTYKLWLVSILAVMIATCSLVFWIWGAPNLRYQNRASPTEDAWRKKILNRVCCWNILAYIRWCKITHQLLNHCHSHIPCSKVKNDKHSEFNNDICFQSINEIFTWQKQKIHGKAWQLIRLQVIQKIKVKYLEKKWLTITTEGNRDTLNVLLNAKRLY